MLYLLDTDHFSLLQRGGEVGARIQSRLDALAPDDYGISVITYVESAKGWLAKVAAADSAVSEVIAFDEMQRSLRFCTAFAMWDYSPDAATQCWELKRQRLGVGTQDLRIASIALTNGATVLTRNRRHFVKVPGLLFADWTV